MLKIVAGIFRIGIIVILGMWWWVNAVEAAPGINRRINFQGKVVNTDGTNVTDGSYDMIFKMYDALNAGSSLWTEVWNSGTSRVTVVSGIFSVDLGTYTTFSSAVDFNSDNLYLSLRFNGDSEMTPRVRMTAVPYAINAEKVGGLTVTNTNGVLSIGSSKTITFGDNFTTINGVGITLDQNLATTAMVNFGGLNIGGSLNVNTNLLVGGSVAMTNIPIGMGSTVLYIGSGGRLVQGTMPAGGLSYTATNGLNLNGNSFGLGGTMTTNSQIGTSSFGLSFVGLGGTPALYIGANSYVGIGTTNPLTRFNIGTTGTIFTGLSIGDRGYFYQNTDTFVVLGNSYGGASLYLNSYAQFNSAVIATDFDNFGALGLGNNNATSISFSRPGVNTNIRGTLTMSGLPVGIGTTILYIDGSGNIVAGTLPASVVATHSKVIVLSPEYAGASLTADGSGTTAVSMTSDNSLNSGSSGWKNYYELTSSSGSLQDYSILVRVSLPSDFSSWETGTCPGSTCALQFNYQTGLATTADNQISFKVANDVENPGIEVCTIGATASTTWGSSGCTESVLNDNSAPEWDAAGETAILRIKLAARNTASALSRVGDIILRYKSSY